MNIIINFYHWPIMSKSYFNQMLFIVTVVGQLFTLSLGNAADCDLKKTTVTLEAVDRPLAEILKEMEKQTQFTIELQNKTVLTNKKNIQLTQTPLDIALSRLLTKHNFSVICDSDHRLIRLVLLGNEVRTKDIVSTPKQPDSAKMGKVSEVMDNYKANQSNSPSTQQQEDEKMHELSAAFESYDAKKSQPPVDAKPKHEKNSMDVVSEILDQYVPQK
jgi:hypothetical protein